MISLLVFSRGLYYLLTGRPKHRAGLTTPCRGCDDPSPHDSHLALGALTYLGRKS